MSGVEAFKVGISNGIGQCLQVQSTWATGQSDKWTSVVRQCDHVVIRWKLPK
jgi:hypothetical protein